MKKLYKKLRRYRFIITVVLAAAMLLAATSYFQMITHEYKTYNGLDFVKWGSPDETANYIFAKLYGQEGRISMEERYNLFTSDIMHPRSFRSDLGTLKPVSFLGIIIIYGAIVGLAGYKVLPFLTPIFAAVGIIFYYLFIKKIFTRKVAWISSIALAFFPVYFYYTARSMFHNVLFIVLLIIGFYFSLPMADRKARIFKLKNKNWLAIQPARLIYAAAAGFFIGLAITVRTSELIWLLPALIVAWLVNIRRIRPSQIIILICFALAAMLPMLYYNQVLYSSPYLGGYGEMNQTIIQVKEAGQEVFAQGVGIDFSFYKNIIHILKTSIFKFGIKPGNSFRMFKAYYIEMFGWLFWSALLGGIILVMGWRKIKRRQWAYLASFFVLSAILVLYYGSWQFHDNPDPNSITIGNSYTRYWLPIYLLSLPLASLFIIRLTRGITELVNHGLSRKKGLKDRPSKGMLAGLRWAAIVLIAGSSIWFVLAGSEEGLAYQVKKNQSTRAEWQKVIELTENNATIITRYHDKIFFPERKVIVGLFDDVNMVRQYARLVKLLPVYYYNFTLPDKDFEYLNERRLKEAGLKIELVANVTGDFSLYRLRKIEQDLDAERDKGQFADEK